MLDSCQLDFRFRGVADMAGFAHWLGLVVNGPSGHFGTVDCRIARSCVASLVGPSFESALRSSELVVLLNQGSEIRETKNHIDRD